MVSEARRILSYLTGEIPTEAVPPQSLWHSPDKCTAWIKEHHPLINREAKGGGMLEFADTEVEKAT